MMLDHLYLFSEALKVAKAMFADLSKIGNNNHIAVWRALLVLTGANMVVIR